MLPDSRYIHSLASPGANDRATAHPLRVLGIYSDLPAHATAMRVLHRLAAGCDSETTVSSVWFSFDRLKFQTEREIAAARAAKADMLWYSGYSDQAPPTAARALIESWSQGQGMSERAIVALIQSPADETRRSSVAEEILRDLVRRSHKPLFLHRVEREAPLTNAMHSREPEVASRFAL